MRVLLVSCVYPPEPVVSSQTSSQIAQGLARRGHEVTVVAPFPSRPEGRLYAGHRRRLTSWERDGGVALRRCFSTVSRKSTLHSRLLENLTFGLTAGWAALVQPRPDVVYANTWPVLATGILVAVARLRRIPVVLSVQDVYPESLVSQGRIAAGGALFRVLQRIDRAIARASRDVIVISESFAGVYRGRRGVDPGRVHVVSNWGEGTAPPDETEVAAFRSRLGISGDCKVLLFGGNVGRAAAVESLIEALALIGSDLDCRLVIAGGGSQLDACRELARRLGVNGRVLIHSPWPKHETAAALGAADVLALPTHGAQSEVSVPSKLISYMLSGRPVFALGAPGSALDEIISLSGCGWSVAPGNPPRTARRLRRVLETPAAELRRRGEAGRSYALRHLTREACLPRILRVIEGGGD